MPLINIGGRNFHVTLTDRNGVAVGMNLIDSAGNDSALEINQANHPRTPLQTSQGQGEYSDLLLPYKELVQQDWSGGRANKTFRKDQTRYLDAGGVDTEVEEQVVLRGKQTYCTGVRTVTQSLPGDVTWQPLTGSSLYRSMAFTVDTLILGANVRYTVWVRKVGSPTEDMPVRTYSDSGGDPNTYINGWYAHDDLVEADIMEIWEVSQLSGAQLSAATAYHFVVNGHSDDDDDNHWEIACIAGSSSGKQSADGSSWSAGPSPYFRVFDSSNENKGEFFIYKSSLYFVEKPDSGTSRLLINGDRGAADSNAGFLGRLYDSSKTWTVNEFAGATALIISGPGSEEAKPWRTIISNTATYLVMDVWKIAHTTETEYVIVDADTFRLHDTLPYAVRDVEVGGEYVYFADSTGTIRHLIERNVGGTWTIVKKTESVNGDLIEAIQHPTDGTILWGAVNNHSAYKSAVFLGRVPPAFGDSDLFDKVGVLDEVTNIWDETKVGTVTLSLDDNALKLDVAAGFVTGILATKRLTTPIDATRARQIGFLIRSNVAASASDLTFLMDDTHYCGRRYIPDYLYHYDTEGRPTLYMYDDSETDDNKWKQQGNTTRRRDLGNTYTANFTLLADDRVYIGFAQRFDRAKWDIDTAQTNAQTMSAEYWDGEAWTAVAGWSDGTEAGGDTLAQDGDMTWTMAKDWNPGTHGDQATYLSQSLYWIKLIPAAALTNASGEVTVENSETFGYTTLTKAKDGDTDTEEVLTFTADDYIYIGAGFRFERIYVNMGSVVNAVTTTIEIEYFNGETWQTLAVSQDYTDPTGDETGATFSQDGDIVALIQHFDWHKISIEGQEAYWWRIKPTADLTPYITIKEIAVNSSNPQELNLPALVAGETTFVNLAVSATTNPEPDLSNVQSIGLRLNTDLGAQVIHIWGPVMLCTEPSIIPIGNRGERITGLGIHGDERTNLIVHTEGGAYEIQSENDNAVVPFPLDELKTIRSTLNGRATCHNDVYHYFNLHKYVQRYVGGSLENVGPDEDEGLPTERAGQPNNLLSHPNRVLLTIDPEAITSESGLAIVMARRGGGWHEMYRAPKVDEATSGYQSTTIEHILHQSSYTKIDRLWIAQGGDLLWVPITLYNPANNSNFYYQPSGHLVTGWFDSNFVDIEKTFTHLKLVTENLSDGASTIKAQYQLDNGSLTDPTNPTHWTYISDTFDTSPSQRIELSTTVDVTAKRLRFRFILDTNDETISPLLKSSVLQLIFMHPIKEVFNLRYRSNDVSVSVDGQSVYVDTALAFDAIIKGWSAPPANILTLACQHPSFNGKTVVAQYPSGKPLESDPSGGPDEETLIRELVVMEV